MRNYLKFLFSVTFITVIFLFMGSCKKENNNSKPSCKIVSPQTGSNIVAGETVTIIVEADDSDGDITEVKFSVDGLLIGTITSSPYNYQWNTDGYDKGTYIIEAISVDDEGASASDTVSIMITEEDPPVQGNFSVLSSYMMNNNLDLPTLLDGWVIDPKAISDGGIVDVDNDCTIPGWTVFDIRADQDFYTGHIKGSINVPLTEIVDEAKATSGIDKILVVCYSGQTSARAVMALKLSGFINARVCKFGFSAWSDNPEFDKWSSKISDQAVGNSNWVTSDSPSLPVNGYPTWTTTSTDGATILADNVNTMLNATGWGTQADNVLDSPQDYSIFNFWSESDYIGLGHFDGAYQYKPISIQNDILSALQTDDENILYCYTGQTASYVVAWLQVLGYNAKSIYNGVNSLRYTALKDAGKPHWHFPYHDYTYETGF